MLTHVSKIYLPFLSFSSPLAYAIEHAHEETTRAKALRNHTMQCSSSCKNFTAKRYTMSFSSYACKKLLLSLTAILQHYSCSTLRLSAPVSHNYEYELALSIIPNTVAMVMMNTSADTA